MFDIAVRPLVWINIKWAVVRPGPGKDAIAVESEASIKVEVDLLDRDEMVGLFTEYFEGTEIALQVRAQQDAEAAIASVEGENVDEPEPKLETIVDVRKAESERFLKVVKRWKQVLEGGQPLDLTLENVMKMSRLPGFMTAFERAYLAACAGKVDLRAKN